MPRLRLAELEPKLVPGKSIRFLCPACGNGHSVHFPFDEKDNGRGWAVSGDSIETLTISPSIDATSEGLCKFHGFITNGDVSWT